MGVVTVGAEGSLRPLCRKSLCAEKSPVNRRIFRGRAEASRDKLALRTVVPAYMRYGKCSVRGGMNGPPEAIEEAS
jgi:hypothetical protein